MDENLKRQFDALCVDFGMNAATARVVERLFDGEIVPLFSSEISPSPSGETLIDMKDLPFYEVVLEKRDENAYLVTGNMKHFPRKPFIVTANEFLEILNKRS